MSLLKNDSQLFLLVYEWYQDENRKAPVRTQVFSKGADIGRDYHCEVYLHSNTVSAIHAKIEHDSEADKWFIVDQQSKNGVIVNNARVFRQEIKNGDRIQLGETLLIVQLRTGHYEKTKSFAIAPDRKALPQFKSVVQTLGLAVLYFLIHLETTYFTTKKSTQEDFFMLFIVFLFTWVVLIAWSFQIRRRAYAIYYAYFQFRAFVYFGLFGALYPIFAMSFLPAKWDGIITSIIYSLLAIGYIYFVSLSFQKKTSHRNALALAITLVVGTMGLKKIGSDFGSETLMGARFAHTFFLPSQKHKTDEMIGALDKAFDRIKENNIEP